MNKREKYVELNPVIYLFIFFITLCSSSLEPIPIPLGGGRVVDEAQCWYFSYGFSMRRTEWSSRAFQVQDKSLYFSS